MEASFDLGKPGGFTVRCHCSQATDPYLSFVAERFRSCYNQFRILELCGDTKCEPKRLLFCPMTEHGNLILKKSRGKLKVLSAI